MEEFEKDDANYKLDITQTILVNIFWIIKVGVLIFFFAVAMEEISLLINETNYLLGLIIVLFTTVKLFKWTGYPRLHFKERDK